LFDGVEGAFTLGRHFEKGICFIAGIVAAPAAVGNAFALRAVPYLAHAAIAYVLTFGNATDAVNVLGLHLVVKFFSPLRSDFLFLFNVIGLRGDVGLAIRADQSAAGYLFFHFLSPFFCLFFSR
jgi:hypothetical protein